MINLQSFKDKEQDYSKLIAPYFSMDKMQRHYHTVNAILAERAYEVDPEYFYKKMFHTSDYFVSAKFYEEIGGMQDELREKRGECVYLTFKDEQPRIGMFDPMFRKEEGHWGDHGISKIIEQGDAKKFFIYPASFHIGTTRHSLDNGFICPCAAEHQAGRNE